MIQVLIIDDERGIADTLRDYFRRAGFICESRYNAEDGLALLKSEGAELVVIDINLPFMNGFDFCREVRQIKADLPILIMSALVGKNDKLCGYVSGADDYIEKPCDPDVLIAKVKAIRRRMHSDMIVIGELRIMKDQRTVFRGNDEILLSGKEFDLLLLLAENIGKALYKNMILSRVWADSQGEPSTLTVHIKWLRDKIERDPKKPTLIQTVWGIGYKMVKPDETI